MTYSRMSQLVEMSIRYWVLTEEKHRQEEGVPVPPQTLRDYSDSEIASERSVLSCNATHCPICEASNIAKSRLQEVYYG